MASLCLFTLLSPLIARAAIVERASTVSPVTTGLPGTWTYAACYVDNANGRVLGNEFDGSATTVQSCIAHCSAGGFTIAAIEYSVQCCESYPFRAPSP